MKPWDEVTDPRAVPAMRHWRELRPDRTQSEVAQAVGLHRSTYNQIEKGRQPLTYRHLRHLCEFYGVDEAAFLSAVSAPPRAGGDDLPGVRSAVYGALSYLADLGAGESAIQAARGLLLAPAAMPFYEGLDAAELRRVMAAQLDTVVLPYLRRRGQISADAG